MSAPWYETAFGAHYPQLYAHRDEAEALRCLELLPSLAPLAAQGRPVLDLGCGDGRHLRRIGELGGVAFGLDLSEHLLALADRRPQHPPLLRGDMRQLPLGSATLDSVLSLFTAFGYFGPLQDNAPVVAEVSRVLAAGGHWFLDYLDAGRVLAELEAQPVSRRERRLGGVLAVETRRLSPDRRQVCKDVSLELEPGREPLRYTEEVALFTLEEMDALAAAHGLIRVADAGSYDGAALGQGDRWILVYRKEGS